PRSSFLQAEPHALHQTPFELLQELSRLPFWTVQSVGREPIFPARVETVCIRDMWFAGLLVAELPHNPSRVPRRHRWLVLNLKSGTCLFDQSMFVLRLRCRRIPDGPEPYQRARCCWHSAPGR